MLFSLYAYIYIYIYIILLTYYIGGVAQLDKALTSYELTNQGIPHSNAAETMVRLCNSASL